MREVAIVGRPNVGKSTLFNRLVGQREAIVADTPGVTRDVKSARIDAAGGAPFFLFDTGGLWSGDEWEKKIHSRVNEALRTADLVLFCVDGRAGVTDADREVAQWLRRLGVEVLLVATKIDDERHEETPEYFDLFSLGFGEPFPTAAEHALGTFDLLRKIQQQLPEPDSVHEEDRVRVAIIGRPNVGKSSLLNKLAGESRVVVDDVAGTTRDPVDELIDLGGVTWRFVDTAGIRRRFRELQGADYYASMRTQGALQRSEVAVVLIDASQPLAEQDLRIITMVAESGRGLVLVFNKWDKLDDERRYDLDKEIDRQLFRVSWAPRVNISARTGRHMEKLVPALETSLENWDRRIPTGRLNSWLTEQVAAKPPPVRGGKQPKILFATQAGTRPPHFILFTSGFLEPAYRRFIERRLREDFPFEGTPLHVSMRIREKKLRK